MIRQKGAVGVEYFGVGQDVTFTGGAFKNHNARIEEIGQKRVLLVLPALGYKITARMADLVP